MFKTKYGGPLIFARETPTPGDVFTFYRGKKDLKFGDPVTITAPDQEYPGMVIGTSADDPRYQNRVLCGGKVANMGDGYYQIKVLEPK